jgi:glyoxylase-like metal-dependent hydrolase (beta-lactamase superfamily II)
MGLSGYLPAMAADILDVVMEHLIPAGMMGPDPVKLDIRAYLVPHASGVVLVDTGMDASGAALDQALEQLGAAWADVSQVVITHGHPDHTGAIDHVRQVAPAAGILASPLDGLPDATSVSDGDVVGTLRVVATPGHTPGHVSLLDESRGVLLVGDCLGSRDGELARAPEQFTADQEQAEQSLHRLLAFRGARMLFGHGPELSRPWDALDSLLRD